MLNKSFCFLGGAAIGVFIERVDLFHGLRVWLEGVA